MPDPPPNRESFPGGLFPPLLEAAVRLAARGHYNQFRKSVEDPAGDNPSGSFLPDRVPYITHLTGTMCILARLGVRDEILAAAVLHDYLEDVPDPDGRENLRLVLGDEVLSLVLEVTEDKRRNLDETDTWYRIEKGEPAVTMGAWFNAATVLGLTLDIPEIHIAETDRQGWIPARIHLADYPELEKLAWHVQGTDDLSPREAMDIYERNQRHLDEEAMTPGEAQLLDALRVAFGLPGDTK